MPYGLRPGITYTWVGNVPIFLDINNNRYFTLSPRAVEALARTERIGQVNSDDVNLLKSFGIIQEVRNGSLIKPVSALQSIRNSYFDEPSRSSLRYIIIAALDQFWAFLAIRCSGLPAALEALRKRTQRMPPRKRPLDISRLIGSYRFIDLFLSAENRCLVRSFALARSLTGHSITFTLAIGVRTGPFGAHCWVQIGDKSLSDHRDKSREYSPVLVL
ncbi:lasso peptide biosynthesis B2 protein [Sphingomonas sp. IW22]|jgi:hypothetical protein|uniref:lasso peptide biosynthesis B2 protein n=1 Tax=Sphingomonas sp. IW22 TaxID=3242489 RepID=UPI00351F8397